MQSPSDPLHDPLTGVYPFRRPNMLVLLPVLLALLALWALRHILRRDLSPQTRWLWGLVLFEAVVPLAFLLI